MLIPRTHVDSVAVTRKSPVKKLSSKDMSLFYMALPLLALVILFSYVPLFGWIYAFCDYKPGVSIFAQHFVGFKYFGRLFNAGSDFPLAFRNTLVFSTLGLICTPLPVIFALMLAEVKNKKASRVMQTVTSLPNFISWVLVFSIFFAFFSNDGFINTLLMNAGIIKEPSSVLGNENATWLFQTAVGIWKSLGWSAIIYIAAISGIDQELYDAADVDGASRFDKIIHITVPGIKETFFVLLLLQISGMLNNGFEQYYVFDNALVRNKIQVLDTYVYRVGLGQAQYAFGTAVGIFKSVVSISLLFLANRASKLVRGESIF